MRDLDGQLRDLDHRLVDERADLLGAIRVPELGVIRSRARLVRRRRIGESRGRVGASEAHGRHARAGQRGDQARVHGPEHRHDELERGVVGDAKTVHLARLEAGGLERRADLAAATVDDEERLGRSRTAAPHAPDAR